MYAVIYYNYTMNMFEKDVCLKRRLRELFLKLQGFKKLLK